MDKKDISLYISEIEKRWRARTPVTSVIDIEPESRVNRSEMLLWAKQNGISISIMDDDLDKAIFKLFKKLRKEFPTEAWSKRNSATIRRMKELKL